MKKRLKMWVAGLLFGGFATIGIAACGVMPTPVSIDDPTATEQDEMINTLFDTKYLDADVDVDVKYQKNDEEKSVDHYHLYGDMLIDIASLDNVMADASLHLDMNDPAKVDEKHRLPIIDLDLTYVDSFAYVTVNERNLKMKTDDFGEVMEIIMGEDKAKEEGEESSTSINNLSNTGIAEIINNLSNMNYEDKGDYYEYVAKTTEDQPDLIIKTDKTFKIENIAISGIKYNDFTIDVNMKTKVLDELEKPIVSPEMPTKPYIDVSTYFGAFKKLRKVLDDEQFSLNYFLELRHYEPATPLDKVYLGYTDGDISMDLKRTIVDIRGSEIVINDPATEGHDDYKTTYQAQYFDENIYLDYKLNNGGEYKLSYSNEGLADLFDMLGDESILGINFWDLIFGTGEKEYPIIDIITDGAFRNITEYTSINFTNDYIELDVDCYLLGGKGHGYIKIYVDDYEDGNKDQPGITKVTIKDLDINSYIVDGELSFKDYVAIKKVNTVDFYPLDNLDKMIRSGAGYYRGNKYALGLDVVVENSDGQKLTVNGDAKFKIKDDTTGEFVLEGGVKGRVIDFSNGIHDLVAESKVDNNDNLLYVKYQYQGTTEDDSGKMAEPFKAKASYSSIYSVYEDIMEAISSGEENEDNNPLGLIAPFVANATKDTLEKVMKGDYFAILRNESVKDIQVVGGNWTIIIDGKALLGLDGDLILKANMNKETLQSIELELGYNSYNVKATVTLNDYAQEEAYIPESELDSYASVDNLTEITSYVASLSNNGKFKVVDQLMEIYEKKEIGLNIDGSLMKGDKEVFSIANGRLDAKLTPETLLGQDLLSRLSLVLSGEFNSIETDEFGNDIPHTLDMVLGYKPNTTGNDNELSIKLGNALKFKCDRARLEEIIDVINNEILKNEDASGMMDSVTSISLPVLEMLNKKDYQGLLETFKGAEIQGETFDELKITLSNGLFNEGDTSTFDVLLKIDDTVGLKALGVNRIKYGDYSLTFNITLDSEGYKQANIDNLDTSEYIDLNNVSGVVYQIKDILNDKAIGLDVTGQYNNISVTGSIDVDIHDGSKYAVSLYITDARDSENIKYHDIRIENDGTSCYVAYAPDNKGLTNEDTIRLNIDEASIQEIVSTIKGMMSSEDSYMNEILAKYIGNLTGLIGGNTESEEESSGGFDIVSLLYKDYFVDNGIIYTEEKPGVSPATLRIVIKGSELGLDNNPVVVVTFNSEGEITNITANTVVDELPAGANITIRDYDVNKHEEAVPTSIKNIGGSFWVGASDLKEVVNFVNDLGKDKQKAVVDQLDDLMTNKRAALEFSMDLYRDLNTFSISTISGNLYIDLSDLSKLENAQFKANGRVTKENVIDSSFDIRLVDKTAYFLYAHDHEHEDFRIKYDLTKIEDLLAVIKKYSTSNPTFKELIEGIFPTATDQSSSSSSGSPLSRILSSGNYLSLFKYYMGTTYNSDDHELLLTFSGDLIGAPKGNVQIGLDVSDYGIHTLRINNFYAFGYYLSGQVTLKPQSSYVTPTAPIDKETYVPLDYVNDMLDDVLSLFGDEFRYTKYSLSGKYDDMLINADIDIDLNKDNGTGNPKTNEGSAKIALTMGKKTHYIQADVNAQLISMKDYHNQDTDPEAKARVEAAADASKILFSYGDVASVTDGDGNVSHGTEPAAANKMYGELNLGSIFDIVKLVTEVTGDKSGRIGNIMEIFSGEGGKTLFMKIVNGDVEALLYNKLIDSFTYNSSTQTYRIVLNENLFKAEEDDEAAPIVLTLSTGDTVVNKLIDNVPTPVEMKYIRELSVEGIYSGKPIELRLLATENEISPISIPSSFNGGKAYNFNSVQDLANGLLNTVLYDDYTFNGQIKLNGDLILHLGFINPSINFADASIDVNSFLHIVQNENDKLEDYYAKFHLSNIPFIRVGALGAYYNVSDDRDQWDDGKREFTIYIQNTVKRVDGVAQYEQVPILDINGNQVFDIDGNPLMKDGSVIRDTYVIIESQHTRGSTTKIRRVKLTMSEFMDNLSHWLVNYGLGIKARDDGSSMTGDKYASLDSDGNLIMQTSYDKDFINLFNYHAESDHQPTFSTVLQSYHYYDVGDKITDDPVLNPTNVTKKTWTAEVDIADLANNDMLRSCGVAIYGGTNEADQKEFIKNLLANINMGIEVTIVEGNVDANVGLTIDPSTVSDDVRNAHVEEIQTYISEMTALSSTHTYREYLLGGASYVA